MYNRKVSFLYGITPSVNRIAPILELTDKKGMWPPYYDEAFKAGAMWMVTEQRHAHK